MGKTGSEVYFKQEKIYRWEEDSTQQIQASGVSGHCQAWG